ncbi:hypothetical protein [Nostoc sp. FACHB-110]|uniref:hypothetical protein n=1 Tax=Nostoc sp. FACHB-110 TaxID=2692834 RepID=UPI0016854A12|nr:hypothetical protein [Nostoc sp. FACHB-110]MBD2439578.1 hypothetical protein [Nostoc sp. FACHB-110]
MRKDKIVYLLFNLTMVGIVGFSLLSELFPVTTCDKWQYSANSTHAKYYAHPVKIIIKPWRGQHHVYGKFLIPQGYQNDGFFTLTLPGNQTYCGSLKTVTPQIDGQPNNAKIRGYLNTRIALWIIMQGHLNDLKQPQNWKLAYFEKRKNKS